MKTTLYQVLKDCIYGITYELKEALNKVEPQTTCSSLFPVQYNQSTICIAHCILLYTTILKITVLQL